MPFAGTRGSTTAGAPLVSTRAFILHTAAGGGVGRIGQYGGSVKDQIDSCGSAVHSNVRNAEALDASTDVTSW